LPEQGFEFQDACPQVPGPENYRPIADYFQKMAQAKASTTEEREEVEARKHLPFPMDLRFVKDDKSAASTSTHRWWMKGVGDFEKCSELFHQAVACYMSDWGDIGAILAPFRHLKIPPQKMQVATICHSIWFHQQPLRADRWLLHDIHAHIAKGGRGLSIGKIFDSHGVLVASTAQEGLVRVRSGGVASPELLKLKSKL
jgi:acyl-CoA thioesterase-2